MPYHFTSRRRFAVAQADLSGRVELFDDDLPRLLGRCAATLLGRSIEEITRPDYRRVSRMLFGNILKTGEAYSLQKIYCGADGTEIPATTHVCLLRQQDGSPEAVVAVIQPSG